MEVREGYKKTEVGVIPEDWECVKFEDCVVSAKLGGNYPNDTKPSQYPLIKMGNIGRGNIILEKIEYVKNTIPSDEDRLNYGDLLFNTRNTLELVGKVAIWRNELPKAYYNSNLLRFEFNEDYVASNFFMNYMLNSKLIIDKLRDIATGTTSVAAIYSRDLYKITLPIPPFPEQQAIATALSDIDNLINSLTKLIAKKKNIKQGAMQELLTGKRRLEGFSGEWKTIPISNIGKVYGGLTGKTKADFGHGKSKYITFLNVINNAVIDLRLLENVDIADGEFQNSVKVGDLFFNTSSETPEEVGMCSVLLEQVDNLYLNSFCFGFRIGDLSNFSSLYLSYLFRSDVGRKLMFSLAQGATRYNLSKSYFYKLELKLPGIEEQTAIANILSDMDTEIEALEEKLNKYKAIKQGMMQELLTGRIRLV